MWECSKDGGEGGIRTPETLPGLTVFKTAAFNHSATSPLGFTRFCCTIIALFRPYGIILPRGKGHIFPLGIYTTGSTESKSAKN